MPPARTHFCDVTAVGKAGFSAPVKMFLNWFIPALVNINVGSLRGTRLEEGTMRCPSRSKYSRKCDRISLTPVIPKTLR